MRALLQTLPELIDELPGTETREAIIFAVWATVIGEQLREISAPIRLEGKILSIAVTGPEWKREFEQHAGQIVYKLNASMKSSVVERLAFVIDPDAVRASSAKPEKRRDERISPNAISQDLSAAASKITDPELRTNFLKAASACIDRRDAVAK